MIKTKEYDIGIVGAGIIGLAHAYYASRRGLKVVVLEKTEKALGASIRNFGLIWPIGQAIDMFDIAMQSRNTWLELSEKAGFWVNANGSLHLAYNQDELDVLTEFQDVLKTTYGSDLLSPKKLANLSPFIIEDNLLGGLYSPNELTVNSREALPLITSYLEEEMGVDFRFSSQVIGLEGNAIISIPEGEKVKAQHIIVTGGSDVHTLFPELFEDKFLVRTKLQMMKAETFEEDSRLGPTLCGGLTLTHYKAFESCKSLENLNKRISDEHSDLKKYGIHVMVSQNDYGELIIGDSHEYNNEVTPFNQELIDDLILDYLKHFFAIDKIKITERWHGIYAKSTEGKTELVLNPEKNVTVVNGLGGAGMTLSFGIAKEIIDKL